jgi:hypothetical protein
VLALYGFILDFFSAIRAFLHFASPGIIPLKSQNKKGQPN